MTQSQQALDRIFNAHSVAVVGASNSRGKFGHAVLETLIRGGYDGKLYPVNPKAERVQGLRAFPSVGEVPGALDLVVVIVPAQYVPDVLREAVGKGVTAAVILSAGFRESGRADLEAEIALISQQHGLRILGPNIQGFNYVPNKLCAMFWPVITTLGPVAVISQSGSVTAALSEWAADEGLGISAAVNLGNQLDLCESDVLEYFGQDAYTRAIALYLEGVKDGRRFLEAVRRVVPRKPVAILKSGRTASGRRSVASHTGALAGRDEVFSAACRQFGLVRTEDLTSLYDAAKALATMRRPQGNRLLVVSTSGGGGTLAVDEAEKQGLVMPLLPEACIQKLNEMCLPPNASLSNPLDLAGISATHFQQAVSIADQFDVADVYLIVFGDPVAGSTETVQYLAANVSGSLAVTYFGGGEVEKSSRVEIQAAGIPVFPTPERAARGIAAAIWDAQYRQSVQPNS